MTVDDLLAWLRVRGYCATITGEGDPAASVLVALRRSRDGDIDFAAIYPTALEGLEAACRARSKAAVRAVDSGSPVGGVVDDGTTTDGGPQ